PLVSDIILRGQFDGLKEVMEKSENLGMKTFDQACFELYQEGLISEEEALRNADSANNVRLKIKFAGSTVGGDFEDEDDLGLSLDGEDF
ncbi:MAG: type IV pili twitching motility protein PilT, partial [Aequoribacter sp.]